MTPKQTSNSKMITAAVLPIKSLQQSKQRLAPLLSPQQRSALTQAMLRDILATLSHCTEIHQIVIVTNDAKIKHIAQQRSIEIIAEPDDPGLNNAVTLAATTLAKQGVQRVLFIPTDVPLINASALKKILHHDRAAPTKARQPTARAQTSQGVIHIVPSADKGGSNCISCAPPDCLPFSFGEQSFSRHLSLARQLNLTAKVIHSADIGLDVDTPVDLIQLAERLTALPPDTTTDRPTYTYRFLHHNGFIKQPKAVQQAQCAIP